MSGGQGAFPSLAVAASQTPWRTAQVSFCFSREMHPGFHSRGAWSSQVHSAFTDSARALLLVQKSFMIQHVLQQPILVLSIDARVEAEYGLPGLAEHWRTRLESLEPC